MNKNKKNVDFSASGKVKRRHWPKYIPVFLLFVGCAILAGYLYLEKNINDGESVVVISGEPKRFSAVRGKQVIDSPYFRFEVDGEWRYRDADSTPDKYYYYSEYKNDRVVRHIRVHVNLTYDKYQVPLVVPVALEGNSLVVLDDSTPKHCNQQGNKDVDVGDRVVIQQGAEFLCDVDGSDSRTAAVLRGGGYTIEPSGTSLGSPYSLIIEYQDVGFSSDNTIFTRALNTFTLK